MQNIHVKITKVGVRISIGYIPFIFLPALSFISFNSTSGIVLQGIGMVLIGACQELPDEG